MSPGPAPSASSGNRNPVVTQLQQRSSRYELPEYLYRSYERLVDVELSSDDLPLLTDPHLNREISYIKFRYLSKTLATNMASRYSVGRGDIVATLVRSTIDLPVIATATWLLGAGIVALTPTPIAQPAEILRDLSALRHVPRVFFITHDMFPITQWLISVLNQQRQQWSSMNQPSIVIIDQAHLRATSFYNHADANTRICHIQDLYELLPDEQPFERYNLSESEAQETTAILYFNHYIDEDGETQVYDVIEMTHSNVIASYRSSLRHSPSTPLIRRRSRSPSSRLSSSVRDFDRPEMHESESSLETAFAVFRMHRAYRLHPTVMDIFCRGAMYVVSSAFDPQTFVQIVSTYRLHNAELTHAEISELVHYLETHETTAAHGRSFRAIQLESPFELLEPLRLVYTESVTAEMDLGPAFDRLLPNVKIIRSRFGSYVAPRH